MEAPVPGIDLDAIHRLVLGDTYGAYEVMRSHRGPNVGEDDLISAWNYSDIRRLLVTPNFSVQSGPTPYASARHLSEKIFADLSLVEQPVKSLLDLDDPTHARLRRLLSGRFLAHNIETTGQEIDKSIRQVLKDLPRNGSFNAVSRIASPLPDAISSSLLGIPRGAITEALGKTPYERAIHSDRLETTLHSLTQRPRGTGGSAVEQDLENVRREMVAERLVLAQAAVEVIEWKTRHLADDLLSDLIVSEGKGELSKGELLAHFLLVYEAANDTVRNMIGNGLHALMTNRAQWDLLVDNPHLSGNAVEELLRFDSPVQYVRRFALEPLSVRDARMTPGQPMLLSLGSANRDDQHFGPSAGILDIKRGIARDHLAFGRGSHFCLGIGIARYAGKSLFTATADQFTDLDLVEEPTHNGRLNLRGFSELILKT